MRVIEKRRAISELLILPVNGSQPKAMVFKEANGSHKLPSKPPADPQATGDNPTVASNHNYSNHHQKLLHEDGCRDDWLIGAKQTHFTWHSQTPSYMLQALMKSLVQNVRSMCQGSGVWVTGAVHGTKTIAHILSKKCFAGKTDDSLDLLTQDELEDETKEELDEYCEEGGEREDTSNDRHRVCFRTMSSVTLVTVLWSLLSIVVASSCALSFFHPYWIMHPDRLHSFGPFRYCVRDLQSPSPRPYCKRYGFGEDKGSGLSHIPAGAWQASTLLYGGGVVLECVGALVTVVLVMLPSHGRHRLALLNGYLQTVAVLIMLAGLLMFPLGFSTPFFQYYCDSTRAYCVGHCRMGWSYVLAITVTALAIFCPVLSNYTDMTIAARGKSSQSSDGSV